MYVVVGLGNPGPLYNGTRHNVGFRIVDMFAERHGIKFNKTKYNGLVGEKRLCGEKIIFIKPMTYMNLSGECVGKALRFTKVPPQNLIVVYDDINFDFGKIRIREQGSAGGHNGIKSIISHLNTDEFVRIRFGVGTPRKGQDLADFVLGKFTETEEKLLVKPFERACDALECILMESVQNAMNNYNNR